MSDDLTKVGHVPRKQGGRRKNKIKIKYVDTTHCEDHVAFRRDCHWCLVLVVERLALHIAELEELLGKDIYENSRHPQRRQTQ